MSTPSVRQHALGDKPHAFAGSRTVRERFLLSPLIDHRWPRTQFLRRPDAKVPACGRALADDEA